MHGPPRTTSRRIKYLRSVNEAPRPPAAAGPPPGRRDLDPVFTVGVHHDIGQKPGVRRGGRLVTDHQVGGQARDLTLEVGRLADPDLDLRTQLLHGDRHDLAVAAWVVRYKHGHGFLHASRLAALYGTHIGGLVHLFLYVFVYLRCYALARGGGIVRE